jgi:hypothetical protein
MGEGKAFLASAANLSTSNSLFHALYRSLHILQNSQVGRFGPSEHDSFLVLGYDRLTIHRIVNNAAAPALPTPHPALKRYQDQQPSRLTTQCTIRVGQDVTWRKCLAPQFASRFRLDTPGFIIARLGWVDCCGPLGPELGARVVTPLFLACHTVGSGRFRVPASMQAKEKERLGKWVQGRFEKARPRHFWCVRSLARLECMVGKVTGIGLGGRGNMYNSGGVRLLSD